MLTIDLTTHYEARRADGEWQLYDKTTGKPASSSKHQNMPGAVTEANGLELLRDSA